MWLDRNGQWFHDGQPIRHVRLSALLSASIARDGALQLIVTTGKDTLPFTAEDAPLHAKTVIRNGERLSFQLSNRTELPLENVQRILVDAEGHMRTRSHDERFWIRLLKPAAQAIMSAAVERKGRLWVPSATGSVLLVEHLADTDWCAPPTSH